MTTVRITQQQQYTADSGTAEEQHRARWSNTVPYEEQHSTTQQIFRKEKKSNTKPAAHLHKVSSSKLSLCAASGMWTFKPYTHIPIPIPSVKVAGNMTGKWLKTTTEYKKVPTSLRRDSFIGRTCYLFQVSKS